MIVAGFGFTSSATLASLQSALHATGQQPQALATLADKAPTLEALADHLNLPLIPVSGPLPETETQSPASLAARQTGSVAEACALAAAGPGAYLLAGRVISADRLATCAIAKGPNP
ncbi:cobalamin biosynthesis protein [Pararhodobacter zhoushanensis]|uniref:cobalamin biosynthesis protein n=1 Tax=Pararhodobacter zhoushanensis TaxID=2479545 RepID=UPI000F8CD178|nr:cobalamin biosynthesis protein [Pararhodobacter zhoushanensis]